MAFGDRSSSVSRRVTRKRRPKPRRHTPPAGSAFSTTLAAPKVGRKLESVKRAERRLPSDPRVPIRPVLAHPTPSQRKAVQKAFVDYHRKLVADEYRVPGRHHAVPMVTGSRVDRERLARLLRTSRSLAPAPLHIDPNVNPRAHEGVGPAEHHNEGVIGGMHIPLLSAGVSKLPGIHQADLAGGFLLDQLERPVHAGASAMLAVRGHPIDSSHRNPFDAALRGFLGKGREGHATYGDVARDSGSTGAEALVAGIGGDVLLNPASFFTGGASGVRAGIEREASRVNKLARDAYEAGDHSKAANLAAKAAKLNDKAASAPENRGIQWGFRVRAPGTQRHIGFRTSGATSAKASHLLGLDRIGGAALQPGRDRIRKAFTAVAPDLRPPGVPQAEWDAYRSARVRGNATDRAGRKTAERRGEFFTSQLGHGEGAQLLHAVENAPKDVDKAIDIRDRIMRAGPTKVPEYARRREQIKSIVQRSRERAERTAKDARAAEAVLRRNMKSEAYARGRVSVLGPQAAKSIAKRVGRAQGALSRAMGDVEKNTLSTARRERAIEKIQGAIATHEARALHAAEHGDEAAFAAAERDLTAAEKRLEPLLKERARETRLHHAQADYEKVAALADHTGSPRIPRSELARLEALRGKSIHIDNHVGSTRTAAKEAAKAHEATVKNARAAFAQLAREAPALLDRYAHHSISALPAHTIEELPEHLQPVARRFQKELAAVGDEEMRAGLLDRLRQQYAPHQWRSAIEKRTVSQTARGGAHKFAEARKMPGSIKEINERIRRMQEAEGLPQEPLLSTSPANLLADRLGRSATHLAHRQMLQEFVDTGVARAVHTEHDISNRREFDALYRIDRNGLHAIEDRHGSPDVERAHELMKKGEDVVVMPKVIGDLERADRHSVMKSIADAEGGNLFDRVNSGMKTVLTVLNVPAYDLRNMMGDLHNAFLGEMDARSLADSVRLMKADIGRQRAERKMLNPEEYLSKQTVTINGVKHNALDLIREAEREGAIHGGYIGAEKHDIENSVLARRAHGERRLTDRPVLAQARHPVSSLRAAGEVRETIPRLGLYISALRRGLSPAEAAKWTNRHLIDYGDLTDAERGILRRIFPFYTFAARNTRLQASAFLRRPGPYATYESTRQEAAKSAGLPYDWEQRMPFYQQRGMGIPVGRLKNGNAKMVFPNLPLGDLNRSAALLQAITGGGVRNELQQTAGNLNILGKAPLELLLLNRNIFFDQAIQADKVNVSDPRAHYYVPAPGWVGQIGDTARKLLGVERAPDKMGNPGYMWPGRVDYIMRLLPQQNFATQVTTPTAGSHGQGSSDALKSQLTGLKFGTWSDPKTAMGRFYDKMNELELEDRKLHDRHIPSDDPRRRKLRAAIGAMRNAALAAQAAAGYKLTPTRSSSGSARGPRFGPGATTVGGAGIPGATWGGG